MKCPFCRQTDTEIYNSRATKFATQTWRRRRCQNCSKLFTTYESPDLSFLRIKRPQTAKTIPYSRAKLFSGLYQAFLDVPRKDATIDAVTDTIEVKVLDLQQPEITTTDLAAIILTTLKHFNTAAFLRYLASHAELATNRQLKQELKKY